MPRGSPVPVIPFQVQNREGLTIAERSSPIPHLRQPQLNTTETSYITHYSISSDIEAEGASAVTSDLLRQTVNSMVLELLTYLQRSVGQSAAASKICQNIPGSSLLAPLSSTISFPHAQQDTSFNFPVTKDCACQLPTNKETGSLITQTRSQCTETVDCTCSNEYRKNDDTIEKKNPRIVNEAVFQELAALFFTAQQSLLNKKLSQRCTQRDLYYSAPHVFGCQKDAQNAIARLCRAVDCFAVRTQSDPPHCILPSNIIMLENLPLLRELSVAKGIYPLGPSLTPITTREDLHFGASGKSIIAGCISFEIHTSSSSESYYNSPNTFPYRVDVGSLGANGLVLSTETGLHSRNFVLHPNPTERVLFIVEKEATLHTILNRDQSHICYPGSIYLCGKGYPCVAARNFLEKLLEETFDTLNVCFVMDGDPDGIGIILSYLEGLVIKFTSRRKKQNNESVHVIGNKRTRVQQKENAHKATMGGDGYYLRDENPKLHSIITCPPCTAFPPKSANSNYDKFNICSLSWIGLLPTQIPVITSFIATHLSSYNAPEAYQHCEGSRHTSSLAPISTLSKRDISRLKGAERTAQNLLRATRTCIETEDKTGPPIHYRQYTRYLIHSFILQLIESTILPEIRYLMEIQKCGELQLLDWLIKERAKNSTQNPCYTINSKFSSTSILGLLLNYVV
eukprot:Tbor_TRINITY_DN5101_c5_g1::TRINITY_DN5101_c5_g1_i1::g.26007::m.26007